MFHMACYLRHAASKQETFIGYSPPFSCESFAKLRSPLESPMMGVTRPVARDTAQCGPSPITVAHR